MKIAPIIRAIQRHNARLARPATHAGGAGSGDSQSPEAGSQPAIVYRLVHTGQHYDEKMSEVFFRELGIPAPDINLEVGSGSHAVQTARIMEKFEPVLLHAFSGAAPLPAISPAASGGEGGQRSGEEAIPGEGSSSSAPTSAPVRPDWLVVVGDVNSTMACTLVAAKLGVRVAHVEAGLRSFDRTMPEEINRLVTDSIADLLLTPSGDADENLRREGVPDHRIRLVGNIMIDALVENLEQARRSTILGRLGVEAGRFAYVTLHRPSNVDHPDSLRAIMAELIRLAATLPVVFPIHPRTRHRLAEFGVQLPGAPAASVPHPGQPGTPDSTRSPQLILLDPLGYHDSLCLAENARLVLTDSGGLQEETTWFRTPCLTLRPNTERPVTVTLGSNKLTTLERLRDDLEQILKGDRRMGSVPQFWEGRTAERILGALQNTASPACKPSAQ